MSTIPSVVGPETHAGDTHHDNGHAHAHPAHLAHHFETPEQQFQSGKLGMWVFLATEILMFGGLFCAYSVYRHNHPEVFVYSHVWLDKILGGINTIVLITSSLTMAWGVRAAMLGQQRLLMILLGLTLLGGFGFMGIKTIEYKSKYDHHVWFGGSNQYREVMKPGSKTTVTEKWQDHGAGHGEAHGGGAHGPAAAPAAHGPATAPTTAPAAGHAASDGHAHGASSAASVFPADPNLGTGDEVKIKPGAATLRPAEGTLVLSEAAVGHQMAFGDLAYKEKERVATFFNIYFMMTGLHGLHVLIGMGLIFWIMIRAATKSQAAWLKPAGALSIALFLLFVGIAVGHSPTLWAGIIATVATGAWTGLGFLKGMSAPLAGAEFGPEYYTPVDLVGLYWHLVDLIWIFLFPLLYLIH